MSLLEKILTPLDLKRLPQEALPDLAEEIRQRIIQVTSANGGHIGPNLGVVELTIALHRVFDSPQDRFVFDVSHQGYVHKLLTGRQGESFDKIRLKDGLSGFLNRSESPYDNYGAGHAGTALSAAIGMAVGRDRKGDNNHVVAVLGDAAFTCGITMEALNNITESTNRLIVILNDNEWSIAKNVGALSKYFTQIITNPVYNRIDQEVKSVLSRVPGGQFMLRFGKKWKKETKDFFVGSSLFETFGMRYIGPIDGHNLEELNKHLEFAKHSQQPILLHVMTVKGKGYEPALASPEKFHGLGPFDITTGKSPARKTGAPLNYQDVFGQKLLDFAKLDSNVVGITAAMPPGTGLSYLRDALPKQFFDVGIAEEHAVLFAAGLATEGYHPVVAIYSTFLQRAYDPVVHDVCLQNLPVTFCMDRAGLSPNDGATHHGLFDIAYLRCIPNTIIMQPKDEDELADMLWTSLKTPAPTFIRYPRGSGIGTPYKPTPALLQIGKAEIMRDGSDIQFWALGSWVQEASALADQLNAEFDLDIGVVNARFVKPIDSDLLLQQSANTRLFVTFEEHVCSGGFGSALLECLADSGQSIAVERIGWPDAFVEHGTDNADLRAAHGLAPEEIYERIAKRIRFINSDNHSTATPVGHGTDSL